MIETAKIIANWLFESIRQARTIFKDFSTALKQAEELSTAEIRGAKAGAELRHKVDERMNNGNKQP